MPTVAVTVRPWQVAIAALVFYAICRFLLRHVERRRFTKLTGSKPPNSINGGFLGLRLAQESNEALEHGRYLALSRLRYDSIGHTYQGSILGQPFVTTRDPENFRAILTRTEDFTTSGRRQDWWPMLQGGLLVVDTKEWKRSRALVQPVFDRGKLNKTERLESHVSRILSQIPRNGPTVDLQQLFLELTFSTGMDFVLGHTHDNLTEAEKKQQQQLALDMGTALFEAGRRGKIGIYRLLDPIMRPRKFLAYLRASWGVHNYFDHFIAKRLSKLARQEALPKDGGESNRRANYVFLDALAAATSDREHLRWEVSTVIAGSRDATAGCLAHVFWELARRPSVWERLRGEVDLLKGRYPTHDDLKGMVYLRAIVQEALRKYPNIGMTIRWAARDTTLPTGGGHDGRSPCFVPKGRRVIMSFNALHHNPDIWGEDNGEFRPERWLTDNVGEMVEKSGGASQRIKSVPTWNYLPFGGGPRICPGMHLAQIEVQYAIVRILQTFKRIEGRDSRPYAEEAGIPITVKHGTLVGLFTH